MKERYQNPELIVMSMNVNIITTSGLSYSDEFGGDDYDETIG